MYRQTGTNPDALVASREKATSIQEIVTAIIGAYQRFRNQALYHGWLLCRNRILDANFKGRFRSHGHWYKEVMNLNGHKYFTMPFHNPKFTK